MQRLSRNQFLSEKACAIEKKEEPKIIYTVQLLLKLTKDSPNPIDFINNLYSDCNLNRHNYGSDELDSIAFVHGLLNINTCISSNPSDFGLPTIPLEVRMQIDHSGSMCLLDANGNKFIKGDKELESTILSLLSLLEYFEQTYNIRVIINIFPTDEIRSYTIAEYKTAIYSDLQFNGKNTDILNNIKYLATVPNKFVSIIFTDGGITDTDATFPIIPNCLSKVWLTAPWCKSSAAIQHADVLGNSVPVTSTFHALPQDQFKNAKKFLEPIMQCNVMPELPGRSHCGLISIPSYMLKPKYFNMLLNAPNNSTFLIKLNRLFNNLLDSLELDPERCFFGLTFSQLMCLCPYIKRFHDEMLACNLLNDEISTLFRTVKTLQDNISVKKLVLIKKYSNNPDKIKDINRVYQNATSVSERELIFESNADKTCIGYVQIPNCDDKLILDDLFKYLKTPSLPIDNPNIMTLLHSMFSQITMIKSSSLDEEFKIPIWKDENGIDIISMLRLLPSYYRLQLHLKLENTCNDFTYQYMTAQRIRCILITMLEQGAKFPEWISKALITSFKMTLPLYDDLSDDNLTVHWMHILLQLSKYGLPEECIANIKSRLPIVSIKWFIPTITDKSYTYETLTYGNVQPFIESINPLVYCVFKNDNDELINLDTKQPYGKLCILDPLDMSPDNQKKINMAQQIQLDSHGSYYQNTFYMPKQYHGKIVIYNTASPSPSQILKEQLTKLGYTSNQINAHIHTINQFSNIPIIAIGSDPSAQIHALKIACSSAKQYVEVNNAILTRKTIISKMQTHSKSFDRILYSFQTYSDVDHTKYPSEIDYVMSCINDSNIVECPNVDIRIECKPIIEQYINQMIECMSDSTNVHPSLFPIPKVVNKLESDSVDDLLEPVSAASCSVQHIFDPSESESTSCASVSSASITSSHDKSVLYECPISKDKMTEPIIITSCGHTFDKSSIDSWIDMNGGIYELSHGNIVCPICREPFTSYVTNFALKDIINA